MIRRWIEILHPAWKNVAPLPSGRHRACVALRIERKRPGFRFMIHVVNAHRAAHRRLECDPLRDSGCIDRQQKGIVAKRSGEIHRPQVGAAKSVVKLVALNNAWWPAAALPS